MKVLIIGLGSIAQKHIYALKCLVSNLTIYALRSSKEAAEVEGIRNIFDLKEVTKPIDFAIVSNPTGLHHTTIQQLTPLDIPLFIEKPLFHSINFGYNLIDVIRNKGIKTYVACNLRFHPCLCFIKKYIEDYPVRINEVNAYCGSYLPEWRLSRNYKEVYSAILELGGGVHLDLIHELDYLYWFFGNPDSVKRVVRNNSTLNISTSDFAHYNLLYEHFVANVTLNYYRRDPKRNLEILFDDKTVSVDLINNIVTSNNEILFSASTDKYYTYIEQMRYFIDSLRTDTPLMNNIDEAFKILKICLNDEA